MKMQLNIITLLCGILSLQLCSTNNFDIILKSKWKNLDNDSQKTIDFGGQWILVGSITFKKKCKEAVAIETINLRWDGEKITNLIASLYKKNLSKNFFPIEENLVCDGLWNKTRQTLIFNFDEKETLSPTTTFYLVLTIPQTIEQILKNGSFYIEEQHLPKQFKECAASMKLSLSIHEKPLFSTLQSAT